MPASECETAAKRFIDRHVRSACDESDVEETIGAVTPLFAKFTDELFEGYPDAKAQLAHSDVLVQFLIEALERMIASYLSGRSVPRLDARPPAEWLESSDLDHSFMADLATTVARDDCGLTQIDAEIVADQVCVAMVNRVKKDRELKARLVHNPKVLKAYIRVATRRLAARSNQRNKQLDVALREKVAHDHQRGDPVDDDDDDDDRAHQRQIIEQAFEPARLTKTQIRRTQKALNGLSNSQIARDEHCSEAAVRKTLKVATTKIKEHIANGLNQGGPH